MIYKAFISYSHAADNRLAPMLQAALQRFAKPFYRLRAFKIFRDTTSLSLTPELWPAIERALHESEYFLLLASETAAKSQWVQKEIAEWLNLHGGSPDKLRIILTDGGIYWDDETADFNWSKTTALPTCLRRVYSQEPHYLDLRWVRSSEDLSLRHPQFLDAVATVAAELHGRHKEDMVGEDVRAYRLLRSVATTVIVLLIALTAVASTTAYVAVQQRKEADRQRDIAEVEKRRAVEAALREEAARIDAENQRNDANRQRSEAEQAREREQSARQQAEQASVNEREQRKRAEAQTALAEERSKATAQLFYNSQINLAEDAWKSANLNRMDENLQAISATALRYPMQGFEWFYLRGLSGEERKSFRLDSDPASVAFSPQNNLLATHNIRGQVELWNPDTGDKTLVSLERSTTTPTLAFFPDGQTAVASTGLYTATLFNVSTGKKIRDFIASGTRSVVVMLDGVNEGEDAIAPIAVSGDGKFLAIGNWDRSVHVWNLENGTERVLRADRRRFDPAGQGSNVKAIAFSPDSTMLAIAGSNKSLALWKFTEGKVRNLDINSMATSLTFTVDGKHLVAGKWNGTVDVYDVNTGSVTLTLNHVGGRTPQELGFDNSTALLTQVAALPDGRLLASGSWDNCVRLWDLATGRLLKTFRGHRGPIRTLAVSKDGGVLASGGRDRTVRLWDVKDGLSGRMLHGDENTKFVSFTRDGGVVSSSENSAVIWDVGRRERVRVYKSPSHQAYREAGATALSSDGRYLARVEGLGEVRIIDLPTGRERSFKAADGYIYALAFAPKTNLLATGSGQWVRLWDTRTLSEHANLKVSTDEDESTIRFVKAVSFSADGNLLATACDSDVMLWSVKTQKRLNLVKTGSYANVQSLAFSPSAALLAIGLDDELFGPSERDNSIILWDVNRRRESSLLKGHNGAVLSLAFSPDGKTLASSGKDRSIRLWNVASGQRLITLDGHAAAVASLAFSLDGATLASADTAGTIRLWETTYAQTARLLRSSSFHMRESQIQKKIKAASLMPRAPA